ncbi:MAG: DUF3515 domain-containing protein [Actinobacteria bacterium]|nr:DUF3515 domain-containing protein [Actinomycetota bacterium]
MTASAAIGPVDVTAPPASAAADQHCPGVISDLPVTLNGSHSRPAHSTSAYVAAWGDPPMVLRCGVPRPAGFVRTSMVISIDGVQWFTEQKPDAVVWTAVDRPVYVEVTVPTTYGSAPIADLSEDLGKALPAQPIKPGA